VKSPSEQPITNADVEINAGEFNSDQIITKITKTNNSGYFFQRVPKNSKKTRFVLNIRKKGYGLFSKIFHTGIQNCDWTLTKGTIYTIDPSKDNTIEDFPMVTKFTGPIIRHVDIDKLPYRSLLKAGKAVLLQNFITNVGNAIDFHKTVGKTLKGIKVTIRADTLEDSQQQPPPAEGVIVTLATVDILGPDSMPGDYTATFQDAGVDQEGFMITYGTGSVDISANGEQYQLKKGKKADIEIPLPVHLHGSEFIPKTIPFLIYNEKKGIWEKKGEGIYDAARKVYTTTTTHLSSLNMDVTRTDYACIVVDGTAIKRNYRLHVDFWYNDRQWNKTKYANAGEKYTLYALPPNLQNITITAFKTEDYPNQMLDSEIAETLNAQTAGSPLEPVPGTGNFPECHCLDNPVMLEPPRPGDPKTFSADPTTGCNFINLNFTGEFIGTTSEKGFKIKRYSDAGCLDFKKEYKASTGEIRRLIPDLEPGTWHYFKLFQFDDYTEELSPNPLSASGRTTDAPLFTVYNDLCDPITAISINGGPNEGGLAIRDTMEFRICELPSVEITTDSAQYTIQATTWNLDVTLESTLISILSNDNAEIGKIWKNTTLGFTPTLTFKSPNSLVYDNNSDGFEPLIGSYKYNDRNCPNTINFIAQFDGNDYEGRCVFDGIDSYSVFLEHPIFPPGDHEYDPVL